MQNSQTGGTQSSNVREGMPPYPGKHSVWCSLSTFGTVGQALIEESLKCEFCGHFWKRNSF